MFGGGGVGPGADEESVSERQGALALVTWSGLSEPES